MSELAYIINTRICYIRILAYKVASLATNSHMPIFLREASFKFPLQNISSYNSNHGRLGAMTYIVMSSIYNASGDVHKVHMVDSGLKLMAQNTANWAK